MSQYESTAPSQAHQALQHHVVTAVLVSHDGARWLPTVLEALLAQQRPVQRIVAVDTGSRDESVRILQQAIGPDNVLERRRSVGYGAAVAHGLKASPPVGYDEFGYDRDSPVEWVWLLHDDSEPAPDALGQLLLAAEDEPDAVVLGPKIRGWFDRHQLMEVGATVAANGRRWTGLERNEHDQGQHDEPRPVLSVSSAGMLVRRDVWDRLRGFDRSISLFRDDLDFCWRVNNAGHQVRVAPDAVVYHAEASARERRRIGAGPNRPHLLDRTHALYSVAVNRPSRFWPALWVRLIVGTLFRVLGFLIGKAPGKASDELFALLTFVARPDRILRGRSTRRKQRAADPDGDNSRRVAELFPPRGALSRSAFDSIWAQLRGNHPDDQDDNRRRRTSVESGPVSEEAETLESDAAGVIARILRNPIVAVGGGLTLVALIAARSILFGGTLAGGALLPSPGGSSDLWSTYLSGWHDVGLGATSAAPPYLAVLAMVGTVLFGKADWAVSVLLIGSVPFAGLSASYALRRVTSVPSLRIWGGYAYALLAVATGAIATGRLGTAVGMALLPVMVTTAADAIGGPGRSGSTRAGWTCAFLLTVGTAFAPVSWVLAAAFGLLSAVTVAWRTRSNIMVVLIRIGIMLGTPIVVLAPWSLTLLEHPSSFFIETGLPGSGLATPAPTPLGLLLGDPGGPGSSPSWIGAGLLVAALAALLRGTRRRIVIAAWSMALVGFGSAVVIAGLRVTPPGSAYAVLPWPGLSTAMLGLGLITATVVGAEGARERVANAAFGWRQPLTLLITGAAVLAPVAAGGWWVVRGAQGPVARIPADQLPAYVQVEGQSAAQPRSLLLTERPDGSIGYSIVSGAGATIGDADIRPPATQTAQVDVVVGELLSGNGGDASQQLATAGIGYVLVASNISANLQRNLDGVVGLSQLSIAKTSGQTFALWAVTGTVGRLTVQDSKNVQLPITYQCGGTVPHGSTQACSQDIGAVVDVPAGASGRELVLAEQAVSGWRAKIGGQTLPTATTASGLQAWILPAGGGTVTVDFHSLKRGSWLLVEGVAFAAAAIMALPFGRRPEEEEAEGEENAEDALESGDDPAAAARTRAPRPDRDPAEDPDGEFAEPGEQPRGGRRGRSAEPAAEPEPQYAAASAEGYGQAEYEESGRTGHGRARPGYEEPGFEEPGYDEPGHEPGIQPQPEYAAPGYETYGETQYEADPAGYGYPEQQAYQAAEEQFLQQPYQNAQPQYQEQAPYLEQPYQGAEQPYEEQLYPEQGYEQPYQQQQPDPGYQQPEYQPEYQAYEQYDQYAAAEPADPAASGQYPAADYGRYGYEVDQYGNLVAPVPEQRQEYEPDRYGYPVEHETDGYGHSEQDGWTR
ncbi:MAG TPA: glycosyltransferase [Actinocrinis sp.]|nr:glycosyltransferase [Actinocrinis sp.]